jgi:hypothetical protein
MTELFPGQKVAGCTPENTVLGIILGWNHSAKKKTAN